MHEGRLWTHRMLLSKSNISLETPLHGRGRCCSDTGGEGGRSGPSQQRPTPASLALVPPKRGLFSSKLAPQRGMKISLVLARLIIKPAKRAEVWVDMSGIYNSTEDADAIGNVSLGSEAPRFHTPAHFGAPNFWWSHHCLFSFAVTTLSTAGLLGTITLFVSATGGLLFCAIADRMGHARALMVRSCFSHSVRWVLRLRSRSLSCSCGHLARDRHRGRVGLRSGAGLQELAYGPLRRHRQADGV